MEKTSRVVAPLNCVPFNTHTRSLSGGILGVVVNICFVAIVCLVASLLGIIVAFATAKWFPNLLSTLSKNMGQSNHGLVHLTPSCNVLSLRKFSMTGSNVIQGYARKAHRSSSCTSQWLDLNDIELPPPLPPRNSVC